MLNVLVNVINQFGCNAYAIKIEMLQKILLCLCVAYVGGEYEKSILKSDFVHNSNNPQSMGILFIFLYAISSSHISILFTGNLI